MEWRIASGLLQLRKQVDTAFPHRSKDSDGGIGDAAHATRNSDHNPWVHDSKGQPIVTAIDITHDPKGGFDSYAFAEMLRTKKDPRIKYVISNRRIFSSVENPWVWRAYTGKNPHDHHVHISVRDVEELFDSTKMWDLDFKPISEDVVATFVPPPPRIRMNGNNPPEVVKKWQKALGVPVTETFDLLTYYATVVWQYRHKLEPDGIVGPQTWKSVG